MPDEVLQRRGAKRQGGLSTVARLGLSAVVVVAGLALVTATSLALFTDEAQIASNTFSAGTVDISTSPASAVVTMSNMVPGDQVTQTLTVANDGTLAMRYAVESTTSGDATLVNDLVLTVKSGVSTCTDAGWEGDGSVLYTGRLGSASIDQLMGDKATGADTGDRELASGQSEALCVNVTLPVGSTLTQGMSATATFDFYAEQTANN